MSNIDDIINNMMSMMVSVQPDAEDPKLCRLKSVVVDYQTNHKDVNGDMVQSHMQKICSMEQLELYISQHYDEVDIISIYKQAYLNG